MNKKQLCIFLLLLITGCSKGNPSLLGNFKAIRCESNKQEGKYNYVFNVNDGFLYFMTR